MKNKQSNTTEKGMAYDRMLCTGLNDAAKQIHEDAKRKGFWDSERETGTLLMLCVSELSEAVEADRKGRYADLKAYNECEKADDIFESDKEVYELSSFQSLIKDTFEDELADTVIRILDLCCARGTDLEKHINLKLKYNRSRERMHGKAY